MASSGRQDEQTGDAGDALPHATAFDSTPALLSRGYLFGTDTARRLATDAFRCRLMLTPAVVVHGRDAARMFYAPDRFTRSGGMPQHTLRLLQGQGSVQTLDGADHAWRKAMFLSLMSPESIARLCGHVRTAWRDRLAAWRLQPRVELLAEAEMILCRAACAWAGVPLGEADVAPRTRDIAAAIDGAGAFGPSVLAALWRRNRVDRWLGLVVDALRATPGTRSDATPAGIVTQHRDADDRLVDRDIAALELCNLIRPTVAIARYVAFMGMALHAHPQIARRLREDDGAWRDAFVQEVRRLYPFIPLIAGRARSDFTWRGHRFDSGAWVLLDVYATDHDPRIWEDPEAFAPERFLSRPEDPYAPIPQGGGGHATGHRCAGEWITLAVMRVILDLMLDETRYAVPLQDARIDLSRMPARPRSGFVIAEVSRAA